MRPSILGDNSHMARPLRIELAGGLYHVTSRGDRREDIFFSEADRQAWLAVLGRVCERFNWVCHAWCQMTNHYHLVVETVEANLSQGMRQLNGVYTQHVNRTHGCVGHVFQGRYKAIHVEREGYLMELARYVVLNPVRAGMVADAGQWPWSSYAAMVGAAEAPPWLNTGWLLGQLGVTRGEAMLRYRDFVRAGVGLPAVWEGLRAQVYLGGDAFVQRMQALLTEPLRDVPRAQQRPTPQPLVHFVQAHAAHPHDGMAAAYATGAYTMRAIAQAFGVHEATVSRAVKRREPAVANA